MKTEWSLVIEYSDGKTKRWRKRDRKHAYTDLAKLQADMNDGRLAPYWNDAVIRIQKKEVTPWTSEMSVQLSSKSSS